MLLLLIGGGSALWDHFTTPRHTTQTTKLNSKGEHFGSAEPAPSNEQPEVRQAIPIAKPIRPVATSPSTSAPETLERLYSVVGVARGDTLNVRSGSGANYNITARLPNGFNGIRIIGAPVMNGTTEWVSITFRDGTGWVTKQYLQPELPTWNPADSNQRPLRSRMSGILTSPFARD